jgi:hypothetical protein
MHSVQTAINLGKLDRVLVSDKLGSLEKGFFAFFECDSRWLSVYLAELSGEKNDAKTATALTTLRAANALAGLGDRYEVVRLLNADGARKKSDFPEWQNDFFYSMWRFIALSLSTKVNSDNNISQQFLDKTTIIGDSHLLGINASLGDQAGQNFYLPGLRLSLLSSNIENMKIVGFRNAIAASYSKENLIISVGEIDFRSLPAKLQKAADRQVVTKHMELFIEYAFKKIKKLVGVHQEILLIAPPPPNDLGNAFDDRDGIQENYMRLVDYFVTQAHTFDFKVIQYSGVVDTCGWMEKSNLVDHAHFKPIRYLNLIKTAY